MFVYLFLCVRLFVCVRAFVLITTCLPFSPQGKEKGGKLPPHTKPFRFQDTLFQISHCGEKINKQKNKQNPNQVKSPLFAKHSPPLKNTCTFCKQRGMHVFLHPRRCTSARSCRQTHNVIHTEGHSGGSAIHSSSSEIGSPLTRLLR